MHRLLLALLAFASACGARSTDPGRPPAAGDAGSPAILDAGAAPEPPRTGDCLEIGATRACYPGPGAPGVGACRDGHQTCVGDGEFGGAWGPCEGAVTPTEEVCGDGVDSDCDGMECDVPTIADLCEALPVQELVERATFPDPGGCPWGEGDNRSSEGGAGWRARTEQAHAFALPAGAVICGLTFDVPGADMWFDDHLLVTFTDVILMSTLGVHLFPADGELALYGWEHMVDRPGSGALYCLGEDRGLGRCVAPETQTDGRFEMSIADAVAQRVGERALAAGRTELRIVTVGDNDSSDCTHSPFDVETRVRFMVP